MTSASPGGRESALSCRLFKAPSMPAHLSAFLTLKLMVSGLCLVIITVSAPKHLETPVLTPLCPLSFAELCLGGCLTLRFLCSSPLPWWTECLAGSVTVSSTWEFFYIYFFLPAVSQISHREKLAFHWSLWPGCLG